MAKKININEVIDRIKLCLNIHSDSDLSKELGKSIGYIAQCRKREAIDWDDVFDRLYDYNFDWLITGIEFRGGKTIKQSKDLTFTSSVSVRQGYSTTEYEQLERELQKKIEMLSDAQNQLFECQKLLSKYQLGENRTSE